MGDENMIRKYLLPILAIAGMMFAVFQVVSGSKPIPPAAPVTEPAEAPYKTFVAGAGLIEASTENIAIGTPVAGVVTDVFVKVGQHVEAGDPLFKSDDRNLQAELVVRNAALTAANEKLKRLQSLPRPEEIPSAEARVNEARANRDDAQTLWENWQKIDDPSAVSPEELTRRRFAAEMAEARLKEAESELSLLKAGSWRPDIEIAMADVASAVAQVKATQMDIERLTVRAPVDGQVLQVNVLLGEFAPMGALQTPLMLLGNTKILHIRVDVDEHDASRIRPGAAAVAFVRGDRTITTDLRFVRIEPYIVPKRSLTGESTERVDTRVLQVIYAFDPANLPVYVGQQMDVFIEAPPIGG
jgi:multidrug resistance efflux pump